MKNKWLRRFCATIVITIVALLKLRSLATGGSRTYKQVILVRKQQQHSLIEQILSLIGIVFLGIVTLFTGIQASRFHATATADPATAPNAHTYGAIAIVFNQRVTGNLTAVLDLRAHDTRHASGQINIYGHLHQVSGAFTPLRCYLLSYGSLTLHPASALDATFNPPPGPGIHPRAPMQISLLKNSSNTFAAYSVTGYVAEDLIYFSLQGRIAGPLYAAAGGRMAGSEGAIGGVEILDTPQTSAGNFVAREFTMASYMNNITINEAIETNWTNNTGALNADTSLIAADSDFANPRRLYLTWKRSQFPYKDQAWELENRVEHGNAQSQDFLAGVFVAVAATAALMCIGLSGRVISGLVMRHIED